MQIEIGALLNDLRELNFLNSAQLMTAERVIRDHFKNISKEIAELKTKESRTFLKYMLCANTLDNHFLKKKDLTEEEKKEISHKCECATFEGVKELWKRYMGFDWKED